MLALGGGGGGAARRRGECGGGEESGGGGRGVVVVLVVLCWRGRGARHKLLSLTDETRSAGCVGVGGPVYGGEGVVSVIVYVPSACPFGRQITCTASGQ